MAVTVDLDVSSRLFVASALAGDAPAAWSVVERVQACPDLEACRESLRSWVLAAESALWWVMGVAEEPPGWRL